MPNLPKMLRAAGLATLVLLCGACGFHLRNAIVVPPELNPMRIVAPDPYSPLAESLSDSLQRAGVQPATEETEEATTLQILSERWGDTPISIDEQGRAQEFSLRYAVIFTLVDKEGAIVVPQQAVELSRDYVAPPADSIGKTSERELLAKEIRREMSTTILRRIGSALLAVQPKADRDSGASADPATEH
jgi:LPS-assembly lipoprotein